MSVAAAHELAGVGFEVARGDAQEGRFARAVAPDEADAFALLDGDRSAVEDGLGAVADDEFGGAGDDGG